ncbi:MAG: helix-turn-helix domain-containing protein [Clostridiales bacterium]|nr:helix-turn-helix domain-containing protein [Clostridiales bacterium]
MNFYTVADIQRVLGVGRNSAYRLVTQKGFPAIYVGNRIVIPADLFQEWVNEQAGKRKGGGVDGKHQA